MQTRQLQSIYSGPPNHDQPPPLDGDGNPLAEVTAAYIRIGQVSGETAPGFFEADVCFYTADGMIINSLTRSINAQQTEDITPAIARWKAGTNTPDDDEAIYLFLLNSPPAFALAV